MTDKEEMELCDAMCKIVDAGTRTVRQVAESFKRFAKLVRATDEEVTEFKRRIDEQGT